ncbi:hypothetical protein BYT27DRAFT_7122973 [Phlegmacium glaucopus]|nr:hypothetical protein BYT27DRAFT_7122973 [Phlegmacium glaucopus]
MVQSVVQPTLDNTVGALLLGILFSALVVGINISQAYFYFHEFPNDSRLHRLAVIEVSWGSLIDVFHLALVVHGAYTYIVTGFGDTDAMMVITWYQMLLIIHQSILTSLKVVVIVIVQSLYAMRVYLLGDYHRGILRYIVMCDVFLLIRVPSLTGFFSSCSVHTYLELSKVSAIINAGSALSTLNDFVIAAAMCYYLRKSKGLISELNSRISIIIQYTVASGLLTSAFSLSSLFSYISLPHTFVFVALQFLLTKLYIGSYLALLNARERSGNGNGNENGIGNRNMSFSGRLSVDRWQPKESQTGSGLWRSRPLSTTTVEVPAVRISVPYFLLFV